MSLILQYHQNRESVIACYFGGDKPTILTNVLSEIQPVKMICGPSNESFFVQFLKSVGYQIVSVRFAQYLSPTSQKCHPQITVVYQQKSPILAMQLANITPSLETESTRLLILDSNLKY